MTGDFTIVSREVIVIPSRPEPEEPTLLGSLRDAVGATAQLVGSALSTAAGLAQGAVVAVAGPPTAAVLDRVVPTVTESVIQRINITQVVVTQVDLREIILRALDRLDLTEIVLSRVDLRRVIDAALDELDLTQIVLERVDLDAIVAAVPLDPVIERLPIVDIAEYVIEQVDLPQIIRESTGGVASDAVDAVRLTSYRADTTAARLIDRVLPRRGRRLDAPVDPESMAATSAVSGSAESGAAES